MRPGGSNGPGNSPPVVLEPAVRAFVDRAPALSALAPLDVRRALARVQAVDGPRPPADIVDLAVPGGPGADIPVRIVRPHGASDELPVVVYLHGGGWVSGSAESYDRLVRDLATAAGAAVVFPSYSLSPEARYPVAVEECYAITLWACEHGAEHGLDGSRLAVAGDSVGGNLATVTAMLAKERGGPELSCQVLFYPVTDAGSDTDSYERFADGYWLGRDAMRWYWDQYTTGPQERTQPTASPLRASLEQLDGLPPALVVTAEADVLRDDGEAYAARLRAAGVEVTAVRYQGTIHDFVMLDALSGSSAARAAIAQAGATLRQALRER